MKKISICIGVCALASMALIGCNAGMGESGPSTEEVKKQIDSMPAEKQIELIKNSPMSPAEKEQKIKAIADKAGIKVDASTPAPGAPGSK